MRKFKIDLTDQNLFRRISIRLYTKYEVVIDGRLTMIILDAICEGVKVFCKTSNKIMHIDPHDGYTIYVYYYRGLKVEIHDAHNRIPKDKLPESIKNYELIYVSDSDKYEIIKAASEILYNKYGAKLQIPIDIIFNMIYETVFCMIEDVYTKYFYLDDIRNQYDSILFTYKYVYVENVPEVYSHVSEETGEVVKMEKHCTKFVNIVFPEIKLPSELLEYKL